MITKMIEVYFDKDPKTGEHIGDCSQQVEFPAKWEICHDCRGKGTTYLGLRNSDQPAFTREDFDREGPDFFHDYMSGQYDSGCQGCGGAGKIKIIDEKACTTTTLRFFLKRHQEYLQCLAEDRVTYEAERRMGC